VIRMIETLDLEWYELLIPQEGCYRCGNDLDWEVFALSDHLCSWCQHMADKDD
jgi:hypothetical protein